MSRCVCDVCQGCPFEFFCSEEIKDNSGNVFVVYSPNTKDPMKVFAYKKDAIKYANELRCRSLFDFYTYKEFRIE